MRRRGWQLVEPGEPLVLVEGPVPDVGDAEVLVEVAGCGVCHTDLGFYHGNVRTRADLPLILGHEVSGTVVDAGRDAEEWIGKDVLVPAVIPCGDCDVCRSGRGNMCPSQTMPGNDRDGGFATHMAVPTTGLTEVGELPPGYELADLAVVADAVTTPLQAIRRAGVGPDDFVVVIGCGGIGTYAVQIAAAADARVVAVDVAADRLEAIREHGAGATVDAAGLSAREVRDAVRQRAKELGASRLGWKVFECSGTAPGQESAFSLLGPAGCLAVVGFTRDRVSVRLSNLMAFDADAFGSWGCPPERYPEAVELVASGRIDLRPFVRRMSMERIEDAFEMADAGKVPGRIVLVPEREGAAP